MKKKVLKSFYQLQILNDGSSLYIWTHPLKNRNSLRQKDITIHSFWDKTKKSLDLDKKSYIQKYTKTFQSN
jgi:hypothetical protein